MLPAVAEWGLAQVVDSRVERLEEIPSEMAPIPPKINAKGR